MKNQQQESLGDIRRGFNILMHVIDGYATAIVPFFRKDFGTAFFGFNSLVAVLVMMVFGAMENDDIMLRYMFLWFLFVAARAGPCTSDRYLALGASRTSPEIHRRAR
jgi:hypothetical protein